MSHPPTVTVVGCGRWGRNLVRTFSALGALRSVVDLAPGPATQMADRYQVPAVELDVALADPDLDAVVVAVPAAGHFAVATRALGAGKHVFVEKPVTLAVCDAEALCAQAAAAQRLLMVGHLLRYHPAFLELERVVRGGGLGRILYASSTRLNLGRIRRDEDALWSLAPHDVSMVLGVIGSEPTSVSAVGGDHLRPGIADATSTHLGFPGGERADISSSWLHPFKEHRLVVVGERAAAVFDDGRPWASKLQLFRHAITWSGGAPEVVGAEPEAVSIDRDEPLEAECRHFLDCVATGATPRTDGWEGLRVVRVLERAGRSMAGPVDPAMGDRGHRGVLVHESAYVDEPSQIGDGTRIWHFSHVLAGSRIGRNCTIGQNVMIGPDVVIGDDCKVQNNVSLYRGVTLEDGVFCGPSCVFTNVAHPRAEIDRSGELAATRVGRGATIGANATVVCGHDIGAWAFVAAGAVVTGVVAPHALVAGVPARRVGWVSHAGERLGDELRCPRTGRRYGLVGPERLEEITGDG